MKNESNVTTGSYLNSDPIFILGIMQRSGTNFLHDLICLHPDCSPGGFIWEDYLLFYSDLLIDYANAVYRHWNPRWKVEETIGPPGFLWQWLGNSLVSFLTLQFKNGRSLGERDKPSAELLSRRLVTKTPSVENLHNFFRIFPRSRLLIIVRDGRSVVESGVRSLNWNFERAIREWANAAKTILGFNYEYQNTSHKYLIIRYEDIFNSTEQELMKIFSFLGLDSEKYDFSSALNLPIKGSSDLPAKEGKKIHWKPVPKRNDFNPLNRWQHWDQAKHERFYWLAGKQLEKFGYATQIQHKSKFAKTIKNVLLDFRWELKERLRSALNRANDKR